MKIDNQATNELDILNFRGLSGKYLLQKDLLLKNLLTNGDFSNLTTGWNMENASSYISNGNLRIHTPTVVEFRITRELPHEIGHEYYALAVLGDSNNITTVGYQLYNYGGGKPNYDSGFVQKTDAISNIYDFTSAMGERNRVTFIFRTSRADSSTYLIVKNLMLIDLTETFGAGNEPSKSEMDNLIKALGYFEETTISLSKIL